jgi:hypothetical protein
LCQAASEEVSYFGRFWDATVYDAIELGIKIFREKLCEES